MAIQMFDSGLIKLIYVPVLMLLIGDLLSTFLYHVPEHAFGKFHSAVHHSANRSFLHYAVLNKNPLVLLDGIAGALPYIIFVPWFWQISAIGTIIGLILGELHVVWRHVSILKWKTPAPILSLCKVFFITTPEKHWIHHEDARIAFGDIFTFFDQPAQAWLGFLLGLKRRWKTSQN